MSFTRGLCTQVQPRSCMLLLLTLIHSTVLLLRDIIKAALVYGLGLQK